MHVLEGRHGEESLEGKCSSRSSGNCCTKNGKLINMIDLTALIDLRDLIDLTDLNFYSVVKSRRKSQYHSDLNS